MKSWTEVHREAVTAANADVVERYGQEYLPCKPDSEAHKIWLAKLDEVYKRYMPEK